MPDTTKPYEYIEMEIDRLKYASQTARGKAALLVNEADTHDMDRAELEKALQKQLEANLSDV